VNRINCGDLETKIQSFRFLLFQSVYSRIAVHLGAQLRGIIHKLIGVIVSCSAARLLTLYWGCVVRGESFIPRLRCCAPGARSVAAWSRLNLAAITASLVSRKRLVRVGSCVERWRDDSVALGWRPDVAFSRDRLRETACRDR